MTSNVVPFMASPVVDEDKKKLQIQPGTPASNTIGYGHYPVQQGLTPPYSHSGQSTQAGGNIPETPVRLGGPAITAHGSPYYPAGMYQQDPNVNYALYHQYPHWNQAIVQVPTPMIQYGAAPATPPQPGLPYFTTQLVENPGVTYTPQFVAHPNGATYLTPPHALPALDYRRGSGASFVTNSPPTPRQGYEGEPRTQILASAMGGLGLGDSPVDVHGAHSAYAAVTKAKRSPFDSPTPMSHVLRETIASNSTDAINTNVYIRGLPNDIDDDKLLELTSTYGNVVSHKAIIDTENGGCKGYGFARFETVEQAARCIEALNARNIEADFARESFNSRLKKLSDPSSTNVYVSNLPKDMNERGMEEIFAGYRVVSNRILRDANNKSRGVGFARFTDRRTCDEIIAKFHNKPIGPNGTLLQIRYADTAAQKKFKATTARRKSLELMAREDKADYVGYNDIPKWRRRGTEILGAVQEESDGQSNDEDTTSESTED